MNNRGILAKFSFFGPLLEEDEIIQIQGGVGIGANLEIKKGRLELFFDLPLQCLSRKILDRYVEVTEPDIHVEMMPAQSNVLNRLLKPLKFAKKSYCLGEYTTSIVLCGIVGEMLAILIWKMHGIKIKAETITESQEADLFGRRFEELGQSACLKILRGFGCITQTEFGNFEKIRQKRNDYVHLWHIDLSKEEEDARNTYKTTFRLYKSITGMELDQEGQLRLNPLLAKFLNGRFD